MPAAYDAALSADRLRDFAATTAKGAEVEDISLEVLEHMFSDLPDMIFAVKDLSLRYVAANQGMLTFCAAKSRLDIIGRRSGDFFCAEGEARYEALDRHVIQTNQPSKETLDLTSRLHAPPVWVVLKRWPARTNRGTVKGVVVTGRLLRAPNKRHHLYRRVSTAVEHIHENFSAELQVNELAEVAGASVLRLERDFLDVFGIAPLRYLTKVRIEAAIKLLRTGVSIAEIAQACGYSDQSAFAKRFKAATGISPREYRVKLRANKSVM